MAKGNKFSKMKKGVGFLGGLGFGASLLAGRGAVDKVMPKASLHVRRGLGAAVGLSLFGGFSYAGSKRDEALGRAKESLVTKYRNRKRKDKTAGALSQKVKEVHRAANKAGIPWDDDPKFKRWSKGLTGTACLDKMSPKQLARMRKAVRAKGMEKKAVNVAQLLRPVRALRAAGGLRRATNTTGFGRQLMYVPRMSNREVMNRSMRGAQDMGVAASPKWLADAKKVVHRVNKGARDFFGKPSKARQSIAKHNKT